jgi:hypothetical protein
MQSVTLVSEGWGLLDVLVRVWDFPPHFTDIFQCKMSERYESKIAGKILFDISISDMLLLAAC